MLDANLPPPLITPSTSTSSTRLVPPHLLTLLGGSRSCLRSAGPTGRSALPACPLSQQAPACSLPSHPLVPGRGFPHTSSKPLSPPGCWRASGARPPAGDLSLWLPWGCPPPRWLGLLLGYLRWEMSTLGKEPPFVVWSSAGPSSIPGTLLARGALGQKRTPSAPALHTPGVAQGCRTPKAARPFCYYSCHQKTSAPEEKQACAC